MGAGRPPKPTILKQLGGTQQPCRTNPNEPVPDVALPLPPDWLSERARQYWGEIGPILLHMKLVSVADGPAMQLLTENLAEWAEARQAVHSSGLVYTTVSDSGVMYRPRPEVAIASDAMKRSLRMLTEFGLTPASRSKVSALGGEDNSDPLADIMRDMKG